MNDSSTDPTRQAEPVAVRFEAAWMVFAQTCGHYWAFAHYLIPQFGIDRVAREAIININGFPDSALKTRVGGGDVRPDAVVTRHPGLSMHQLFARPARTRFGEFGQPLQLRLLMALGISQACWWTRVLIGLFNSTARRWSGNTPSPEPVLYIR